MPARFRSGNSIWAVGRALIPLDLSKMLWLDLERKRVSVCVYLHASIHSRFDPWEFAIGACFRDIAGGVEMRVSCYILFIASSVMLSTAATSQQAGRDLTIDGLLERLSKEEGQPAPSVPKSSKQNFQRQEARNWEGSRPEPTTPDTGSLARVGQDRAPAGSFDRTPPGSLSGRDYSMTKLNVSEAVAAINKYRKEKGLNPVSIDAKLTRAASVHAKDLARWDRISHYGSDGSNPWDRVKRAGYNAKVAAENVGTGQTTFAEVLKGWQESPGHNRNLLMSDVVHVGLALEHVPKAEFKTFWVISFASPH